MHLVRKQAVVWGNHLRTFFGQLVVGDGGGMQKLFARRSRLTAMLMLYVLICFVFVFMQLSVSPHGIRYKLIRHNTTISRGVFEPCKTVNSSNNPTDLLINIELGWDMPAPQWVVDLCPEVIEHLDKFPYFKNFPSKNGTSLPVSTTEYTALSLCTLKVLQRLATNMSISLHLDAGSHLGAARHGQPIPWDDDIDVAMPRGDQHQFLNACNDTGIKIHPTAELRCFRSYKCFKIYVEYDGIANPNLPGLQWKSPFVDIFLYDVLPNSLRVHRPQGQRIAGWPDYPNDIYLPLEPIYFGGLHVLAPQVAWAEWRYSFTECLLAGYNHRKEYRFEWKALFDTLEVDCCRLAQIFPFVYDNGTMSNGQHQIAINVSHL